MGTVMGIVAFILVLVLSAVVLIEMADTRAFRESVYKDLNRILDMVKELEERR